jgi:Family of unknown function (DUF6152)
MRRTRTSLMESGRLRSAAAQVVLLLTALASVAGPARAHHSSAMFDREKQVTLAGEIQEYNWTNPHCSIVMSVADPGGGKAVMWSLEGGSPNEMVKLGWRRSTLKPGDKVTVVSHPLKDGRPGGTIMRAILADGTVLSSGYIQ